MEIHVSQQAFVFLMMVVTGMIASVIYDIFRVFRRLYKMPGWAVFVCDMFFWLACTLLTFLTVNFCNSGELRWFVFAGFVIGGMLYFSLLARVFSAVIMFLLKVVVRIISFFMRIFRFAPCKRAKHSLRNAQC